jgi:thiamine-monophosphate kinase
MNSGDEFGLIEHYFAAPSRQALAALPTELQPDLGIGDDCALLGMSGVLAVSTDTLVAGVHFFPETDPERLGHKCLAVNLSDLAAMGARPRGFTLAITMPTISGHFLKSFSAGLMQLAQSAQCPLVGGDTTRGPLSINITVLGDFPLGNALRRDQAQIGDDLWLSGSVGAAAWALKELQANREMARDHPARLALERPLPAVKLGSALATSGLAHAAVDVSDGLISDLGHVLKASSARSVLHAQIDLDAMPWAPCLRDLPLVDQLNLGLCGGDDYVLLFTAAPDHRSDLQALFKTLQLTEQPVRVGRLQAARPSEERIQCLSQGQALATSIWSADKASGFNHFKS